MLTGKVTVDGAVFAESAPLFFLDGRTLNPLEVNEAAGTAVLEGTTVSLTKTAADALNMVFETDALAEFFKVGIAEITVDLPKPSSLRTTTSRRAGQRELPGPFVRAATTTPTSSGSARPQLPEPVRAAPRDGPAGHDGEEGRVGRSRDGQPHRPPGERGQRRERQAVPGLHGRREQQRGAEQQQRRRRDVVRSGDRRTPAQHDDRAPRARAARRRRWPAAPVSPSGRSSR